VVFSQFPIIPVESPSFEEAFRNMDIYLFWKTFGQSWTCAKKDLLSLRVVCSWLNESLIRSKFVPSKSFLELKTIEEQLIGYYINQNNFLHLLPNHYELFCPHLGDNWSVRPVIGSWRVTNHPLRRITDEKKGFPEKFRSMSQWVSLNSFGSTAWEENMMPVLLVGDGKNSAEDARAQRMLITANLTTRPSLESFECVSSEIFLQGVEKQKERERDKKIGEVVEQIKTVGAGIAVGALVLVTAPISIPYLLYQQVNSEPISCVETNCYYEPSRDDRSPLLWGSENL